VLTDSGLLDEPGHTADKQVAEADACRQVIATACRWTRQSVVPRN
jgi:hypothetical protein